jgi:hypothetical protein
MRKKSWIDYLLTNQCSSIRTQIGQYSVQTLYQKGRLAQLNKIMGEYKLAVLVLVLEKIGYQRSR